MARTILVKMVGNHSESRTLQLRQSRRPVFTAILSTMAAHQSGLIVVAKGAAAIDEERTAHGKMRLRHSHCPCLPWQSPNCAKGELSF